MNSLLKEFARDHFPRNWSDLFAMFLEKHIKLIKANGLISCVTPYVWMFITTYESFRDFLLSYCTIISLIQLEYNAFEPACIPVATFTFMRSSFEDYKGEFIKLSEFKGHQNQAPKVKEAINDITCHWRYRSTSKHFCRIPGRPIAYWVSDSYINAFDTDDYISSLAPIKSGIMTGDDERFLKYWFEVYCNNILFGLLDYKEMKPEIRWYPLSKGGDYRKWYGNIEHVINLQNDAWEIKNQGKNYRLRDPALYFKRFITWSRISSSDIAFRYIDGGILFSDAGPGIFVDEATRFYIMGLLNSNISIYLLKILNPTLNYQARDIGSVPVPKFNQIEKIQILVEKAISLSQKDWDSFETSWDFQTFPWLSPPLKAPTTIQSFQNWQDHCNSQIKRMQELETENNCLFIEAYGLQDELTPEVPEDQITLARADQEEDVKRLLSYSIGCMMGRYSLDEPGLIYAHSGNVGFNPGRYKSFPADDDGIIPITEIGWFPDDATNRLIEFLKVAWSFDTIGENLRFIADTLGPKRGEDAHFTIRRYFANSFFKDHLKTYKKRPIYWLFTSGKEKAFQCLVYLHRYNESTLSRMRSAYVTPLFGKFNARLEYLQNERDAADTASTKKKFQKEIDGMKKKLAELSKFDAELRHYADKRISLDLDDGVKVNYAKFGNLLAEKKTVTG